MLGAAIAIPRNSDLRIQQLPVRSVIASLQLPLRGATTHILVTGGDSVVGSLGMATIAKALTLPMYGILNSQVTMKDLFIQQFRIADKR